MGADMSGDSWIGVGVGRRAIGRGMPFLVLAILTMSPPARGDLPIEREPINYLSAPAHDPVARLQERLDRGEVVLKHEEAQGYLKSVLEQLGVSPTSQTLVFSKTSFQHTRISPRMPRALYF